MDDLRLRQPRVWKTRRADVVGTKCRFCVNWFILSQVDIFHVRWVACPSWFTLSLPWILHVVKRMFCLSWDLLVLHRDLRSVVDLARKWAENLPMQCGRYVGKGRGYLLFSLRHASCCSSPSFDSFQS